MIDFNKDILKEQVFKEVELYLQSIDFQVVNMDSGRPWGGFFVIDEAQSEKFISYYFPLVKPGDIKIENKLSPKILVVAPGKRLSWQYHHRRAEIWKVIGGRAAIVTSDTDKENEVRTIEKETIIKLQQGERHRLIGTEGWGIIAEIWQHTDPLMPSDENDIVRVQDDFGR